MGNDWKEYNATVEFTNKQEKYLDEQGGDIDALLVGPGYCQGYSLTWLRQQPESFQEVFLFQALMINKLD